MISTEQDDDAAPITDFVRIPVRWAGVDVPVKVGIGQSISRILEIVASEHGLLIEELIVIRDGTGEPLNHHEVVGHDYPHQCRHHVHHRHPIEVTVHYQAESRHHEFRRQASLESVLDWSIGGFNIDPTIAGEFELTLAGSTEELPLSEQIGHLACKHNKLELNLVRGAITNGAHHG